MFSRRLFSTLRYVTQMKSHMNNKNIINNKLKFTTLPLLMIGTGYMANEFIVYAHHEYGPEWQSIKEELEELFDSNLDYDDGSYGPVIVRLAWHASGTYNKADGSGGSNGATMRYATEANDGANAGLSVARDLLEPIKKKYPNISYADLWTFAGCVAIEHMGGPHIDWSPGRKDKGPQDCPPNGRLPDAAQGSNHIRDVFYRMGFSDREIVALAGAHVLGRCHTSRSGFDGPWTRSPTTFSNEYFRLLVEEKWVKRKWSGPDQYMNQGEGDLMMLPADIALRDDPKFGPIVQTYAKDQDAFFNDFAAAYAKLLSLGCSPQYAGLSGSSSSAASNGGFLAGLWNLLGYRS